MSQRQLLENSINLLNRQSGPAKILYAPASLPMPTRLEQVIDPTGGAPATGWSALGFTRGGINVTKRMDKQTYNDIDQIRGTYAQALTDRGYTISTQLGEVLDRVQMGLAFETGTTTQVSTSGPTQVRTSFDSGANDSAPRRVAVVFPKATEGKAMAFVFRSVEPAGGDRVWRFDKADQVSPALDLIAFPEIATAIPSEEAYMVQYDIL